MGAPEYRRATLKVRALRVTFRDALKSARELPQPERGRAVADVVQKAQTVLAEIGAEVERHDAADVGSLREEVESVAASVSRAG